MKRLALPSRAAEIYHIVKIYRKQQGNFSIIRPYALFEGIFYDASVGVYQPVQKCSVFKAEMALIGVYNENISRNLGEYSSLFHEAQKLH